MRKNEFFKVNSVFSEYFSKCLEDKKSQIESYLIKRNLTSEDLNQFKIGYCDWEDTLGFIKANNLIEQTLLELGILKKSKEEAIYPFFYNRLIFPIFDQYGRCVAFSGRRMDSINDFKYINSPASIVFHKKRILYALNLNYDLLLKSKFVFLVEGYLDVISLFRNDFKNVVCSMGTAFTEEQAKLLRRYVNKVVILYDGDKPGKEASQRAEDILKKYLKVKKIFLPDEDDPDSFVNKHGGDELKKYIKERL